MSAPRTVIATFALLVAAAPAFAQGRHAVEDGYAYLEVARLKKLTNRDVGKKYYVEGRWHEFYRPGISFYKQNEVRKYLIVGGGSNSPMAGQLVMNLDTLSNRLEKKRSMVRVKGVAQPLGGRIVLSVHRVDKLADEDVQYLRWLAQTGGDLQKLRKLAQECATRSKEMSEDSRLRAVSMKITSDELKAWREVISETHDYSVMIELALRYEIELRDERAAIQLFSEVRESPKASKAVRTIAQKHLSRKKAVRVRKADAKGDSYFVWVTFSDYKHAEGFVFRKGQDTAKEEWARKDRWVHRERAELEEATRQEVARRKKKVEEPRTNPFAHGNAAEAGKVERGQLFVEVAHAIGFPKTVSHWAGDLEKRKVLWTQWIANNGYRVYFVDGEVISHKTDAEDWPRSEKRKGR